MLKANLYQVRDIPADAWIKSSFSAGNGGGCVEFARIEGGVALRDSKNPELPHLCFEPHEIAALIAGAKAGEFDHLV